MWLYQNVGMAKRGSAGDGGEEGQATASPVPEQRTPASAILRNRKASRPPGHTSTTGPTPTVASQPARPSSATLSETTAKSRFGVTYFKALCAQAHVGFNETPTDEDVLALDGIIPFEEATVSVQIKCTSQFSLRGTTTATWPADIAWRDKWAKAKLPVYFVLVIVDKDYRMWLDHSAHQHTLSRAAAFWVRIDPLSRAENITVPRSQRLTADTFQEWWSDVLACFGQEPK